MTRQEAQNLLAGYATGSLSGAERRALFEAALQDQDLFEELAGEHMLKEILDQPGARERLIAALEPSPSRSVWWMRRWPWAAAATILAIAIGVIVMSHTRQLQQESQQIAQVLKTPETLVPQAATPVPAPAPRRKLEAPTQPPPAKPPAEVRSEPLADRAAEPQVQAFAKGGAVGQLAAPATRNFAAAKSPVGFALSYEVQADGFLQIVPAASGYLSVVAGDAVIFPSAPVRPETPLRIAIPADATMLTVNFSASALASATPIRLDAISGTVADQFPPTQRISIQIPARP